MKSHVKIGALACSFVLLSSSGCAFFDGGSSDDSHGALSSIDERLAMTHVSDDGEYDFCDDDFMDSVIGFIPRAEATIDVEFHSAFGGRCVQNRSVESLRDLTVPNHFELEIQLHSVENLVERHHAYDYDWSDDEPPLGIQGGESECALVNKLWPSEFHDPASGASGVNHRVPDGEVCVLIPEHVEPTFSTAYVRDGHFILATFGHASSNRINVNTYTSQEKDFNRQLIPTLSSVYQFFTGERFRNFADLETKEAPGTIEKVCDDAADTIASAVASSPEHKYSTQFYPWEDACVISASGRAESELPVDEAHEDTNVMVTMRITSRETGSSLDNSCFERGSSAHLSPLLKPTKSAYGELCLNGNEYRTGQSTYVMGAWQDGDFIGHFSMKVRENVNEDVDSDFSGNWEAPWHVIDQIFET